MRGLRVVSRSLRHYSVEKLKPFRPWSLISIFPENSLPPNTNQWLYQTRRTLILEPTSSQFVKLERLSDSDSGKFLWLHFFINFNSSALKIVNFGYWGFLFLFWLWCLVYSYYPWMHWKPNCVYNRNFGG